MSARLSVTVITSVETRLNAATATISVRMMNIMRFSTCTAANQLRFGAGPVAHHELGAERCARARAATSRAWCRSFERSCTPVGPSRRNSLAASSTWIQRQAAVVLVVAGVEGADHGELLQARHHAGRRDLAAGRDQRDLVAVAHAERARQLDAEHDVPNSPGTRRVERRVLQLRGEVGDRRLRRSASMPRTIAPRIVVAARRSAPARRRRAPRRSPRDCAAPRPRWRCQSGSAAPSRVEHLDVRDHRQHAVAHFLLEAVHHRQHDDQRGHAERDAEHRDAGDEGDEAVAPRRPGRRACSASRSAVRRASSWEADATGGSSNDRGMRRDCADNRRMHLLIPFASALSQEALQVPADARACRSSSACWRA